MPLMTKIKSRLGGGFYKRIRTLSKYEREFTGGGGIQPSLEYALIAQSKKMLKTKFFLGHAIAEKGYYENLRSELSKFYTSTKNSELLDFDGIIIPKSSNNKWDVERAFCSVLAHYVLNDTVLVEAVWDEEPYEFGNVQVENGDVVIDSGANLGTFSAIASHKGATAVYAFEPNQVVIDEYLSITATHNPNIHICNYALSNKKDELKFAFDNSHLGAGTLSVVNPSSATKKSEIATVSAITLDEFIRENNIPKVDFIKADIEGAERYMLMGAKQVLKEFAPKLAICTYHLPDDRKVIREIILDTNPDYVIEEKSKKLYAYVPKR